MITPSIIVFQDGRVCISILHPSGEDPMSGERPEERWLPTQTVSTIILSVISILGDPNFSSPANVDASVEAKDRPEMYRKRVRKLVEKARARVPSHVKVSFHLPFLSAEILLSTLCRSHILRVTLMRGRKRLSGIDS